MAQENTNNMADNFLSEVGAAAQLPFQAIKTGLAKIQANNVAYQAKKTMAADQYARARRYGNPYQAPAHPNSTKYNSNPNIHS